MKTKFTLLLAALFLFKSFQFCSAQNANTKISMAAMPAYVKELQKAPPLEEIKYSDPALYNHLKQRRAILTRLLQQQVNNKILPKEALAVLQNEQKHLNANVALTTNKESGDNFHLVKDINTSTSSNPNNSNYTYTNSFAVLNNIIYYTADDGIHGNELWRSDGTSAGTRIVKDINSGSASSGPAHITEFKGKIYFSAYKSTTGVEIYQSDGTSAGTGLLQDIAAGGSSSYPVMFTPAGNDLYFTVQSNSSQLWKTDGTKKGTVMVSDLSGIYYTYGISQLTYANKLLFFTANNYMYGRELWRSDGTAAGTFMVKDINSGNIDVDGPEHLTALNNRLYFSATDISYYGVRTLWESDGTTEGTKTVKNDNYVVLENELAYYYSIYQDQPFAIAQNSLFFVASTYNTGAELYKYNINDDKGIVLVRNIADANAGSFLTTNGIRSMNDSIYFVIPNFNGTEYNLWKSGGSAANTFYIKTLPGNIDINNFYSLGKRLYFTTLSTQYGTEPWISDGTKTGTKLLSDINPGGYSSSPAYFTLCDSSVYFSAFSNSEGRELWATNNNVTHQVKDINTNTTESSVYFYDKSDAIPLNNSKLLFRAFQPSTGYKMWQSDGTEGGTFLVDSAISSYPNFYDSKNGKVYLTVYNSLAGSEDIFVTDGTDIGTKKIISQLPTYYITDIKVADNGVIFYTTTDYSTSGSKLWRTDSTGVNNLLISGVYNIGVAGNYCYFSYTNSYGQEPWRSDGTIAGTYLLADVYSGTYGSYPSYFTPFGNKIIFQVFNQYGGALCISDGTTKGTKVFTDKNINPNLYQGSAILNGNFYFGASDYTNGYINEVYRTDGTTAGTILQDINNQGNSYSYPQSFTTAGNFVYFTATDAIHGQELWRTNAKKVNTEIVKDIAPGLANSNLYDLTAAGDKLYFLDSSLLWVSDGTDTGTYKVSDAGLTDVNDINDLTGAGNKLFFSGNSYAYGYELYEGDASANKNYLVNNAIAKTINTLGLTAQVVANPFLNDLKVNINSPKNQELQLTITNYAAQQMINKTITVTAGMNLITLNAETWIPGVYAINIFSDTGIVKLKAIK